ncbi:hypothetical protein AJ78_04423 [Emergomyces pasteurianus Ep9510]|uniref:Uncharacterized protein n=1 Tax=Emergomyces pasteurianus Ep9510 TaxID=1447872 RepID=A0A1J9PHC3_9EURO|nr:hypothetical protein AJ78_04423 [Emergomyces pasteurianus Ep9510]
MTMLEVERADIEALFGRDQSVDYTQGFGNFLYKPSENHVKHDRQATRRQKQGQPPDKSDGLKIKTVVVANEEGRQQNGFPLMRLPLEIRFRIYDLLLESLLGGHYYYEDLPDMMGDNGARFRVSDASYHRCSDDPDFTHPTLEPNGHVPEGVEDLFGLYKEIREGTADDAQVQRGENLGLTARFDVSREIDEMTAVSTSDEDEDEDEDEDADEGDHHYDSKKEAEEHDDILMKTNGRPLQCQDGFGTDRPVYLQVYQGPDTSECTRTPDNFERFRCDEHLNGECLNVDLECLRPLFYVSHQSTRDISACLWKNAIIKFEAPECFFTFIATRPAILKFLKCIELELQYYDDWFDTSSDTVVAICQFISEYMDLRYIRIHLVTEERYVKKILEEQKLERWKTAFNELKVSHGFDLRVVDLRLHYRYRGWNMPQSTLRPLEQRLKELWCPSALGR